MGKSYTEDEMLYIITKIAVETPFNIIAEKTGRTAPAVRVSLHKYKLNVLDIKKKARAGWTAEDILKHSIFPHIKKDVIIQHKVDYKF